MNLVEQATKYYRDTDYNCAEAMLHAGNDVLKLSLSDEDMVMMAGFGAGMYSGLTCGALIAGVAILSKLLVKTNAHAESGYFKPIIQSMVSHFEKNLGSTQCQDIRPFNHTPEQGCIKTVIAAAQALEQTLEEAHIVY